MKNKIHKKGLKSEIMDKILEVIYEYPEKKFTIREIERKTKVPKSTVQKYLSQLKNSGLIDEKNQIGFNLLFKIKKTNYLTEKIIKSGLISEIIKELNPSCIILFGSVRKGESNKESDIDLFVESFATKKINLKKFEKKLGHKIQLFIEKDIRKLPKELLNNVVNGIKLFGSFKT